MQLSLEQITALSGDAVSLTAGKRLAAREHWTELGKYSSAVWGICPGSADNRVRIDLRGPAYRCSCPSRKSPCKHVLALLLMAASTPECIPEDEPPDWVGDWLEKRTPRNAGGSEGKRTPARGAVKAKTRQRREANVQAGFERLDLWIRDLVRSGLAGAELQPRSFWEDQAKRLVDSQAPGVARRIRRLADLPGSTPDWPLKLLEELGRIKLLMHAYGRLDRLTPALQQEVRQLIGWNVTQQELEQHGELVDDEWFFYGQWVDEDTRLRTQRTWAVGRKSGRTALILQFAPGTRPFPEAIVPGVVQRASLRFFPGALALRAKVEERPDASRPIGSRLSGFTSISAFLEDAASLLARQPWMGACGCVLRDVRLTVRAETWYVRDAEGAAVPLTGREYWEPLAITGGGPCDIMGEYSGEEIRPLGLFFGGGYRPVA